MAKNKLAPSLSRKSTWANMPARSATLARLDSSSSTPSEGEESVLQATIRAILGPSRLAALDAIDVAPVPYNPYSFFSYILSARGRNFPMLAAPLLALFLWGLFWQLLFVYDRDESKVQAFSASMDELVAPILTPLSFLLTFRLARAAVRFWDARAATGKIVEICRSNIATVSVGIMSPIRLRKGHGGRWQPQNHPQDNKQDRLLDGRGKNEKNEDSPEELELLCEYAKWLAVFPIAVKHFLRPETRKGWEKDACYRKRRYEIGPLLSEEDCLSVIMEYDDESGKPTSDSIDGIRARDPPLVVLNRLHELAYDIAYFTHTKDTAYPTLQGQAIFYQQMTDQINTLCGAYGAMERIKITPLPFAYVIHLRTFLFIYLLLWNKSSVAMYGWESLPCLFLLNWALLGIEAAAVVCERPFDYNPNHLTLGKVSVVVARNIGQALKQLAR